MKLKKIIYMFIVLLSYFNVEAAKLKQVDEFKVDVFIGMLDVENESVLWNSDAYSEITASLLNVCHGSAIFCDMEIDSTYEEVHFSRYYKEISGGKKIIVTVYNSGFTNSLNFEEESLYQMQLEHSEKVRNYFLKALQTSDKVIYLGHSRFGGGPDFNLPIYIDGTSKINIKYYQSQHKGLNDLIVGLRSRNQLNQLQLGLFSCNSANHFTGQLSQFNNKVKIEDQNAPLGVGEAINKALKYLNGNPKSKNR